jgi:hypothetical protein
VGSNPTLTARIESLAYIRLFPLGSNEKRCRVIHGASEYAEPQPITHQHCSQKRRAPLHTRKAKEAPRYGWKQCDCPIYASGTLKDGFRRKKTDYTTWPDAEKQATTWEQAGSWGAPPLPVVASDSAVVKSQTGLHNRAGLQPFIDKCERRDIEQATVRKYKTFTKQFQEFCKLKRVYRKEATGSRRWGAFLCDLEAWRTCCRPQTGTVGKLVKFWQKQEWISHDRGVFDTSDRSK